ncbi:DUF4411 family protein [Dyella sedimenti]|uniref:DUF4411 family protein n=1 Tax=Dyella sedimenti TaxID=2919947 RepID=UPI001FAA38F7|nr:DUF4411 family protein [Dyella sedimenti]
MLDANVLIQAKNFHYRFEFCAGFWTWLEDCHGNGLVFSVNKVKSEICAGKPDDAARVWCQSLPSTFFIPDDADAAVMANYAKLMNWAASTPQYTDKARAEFADGKNADPFLVATAMTHGHIVVSHESVSPAAQKRIPLPNAASAHGVKTISVFDLLSKHAHPTFLLQGA